MSAAIDVSTKADAREGLSDFKSLKLLKVADLMLLEREADRSRYAGNGRQECGNWQR